MYLSYPSKTSGYLVKQVNYTHKQIGFQDSIVYFSPVNPIQIELYVGKLNTDFEDILCGVRGLSNVAEAINNYNHNTHKNMKISKLHMRMKMTEFTERKLKIPHIWKIVYSNKLVMHRLNMRTKFFRVKESSKNMRLYQLKILNYLSSQRKFIKSFLKGTIPKEMATDKEKDLVERYGRMMDQTMAKMEESVGEGRYDEMIKKQEFITLGRINKVMLALQRHPKNIMFVIVQDYLIYIGKYGGHNQTLKSIMFYFFRKLGVELKRQQRKSQIRTLLNQDLELQLKEIHGLCDKFVLEYRALSESKSKKGKEKRFKSCYNIPRSSQRFLLGSFAWASQDMADQIFQFAQAYKREPSMNNTLKKYGLLTEPDLLNVEKFRFFFKYIGQQVTSLFRHKSYSWSMFKTARRHTSAKHQLI